MTSRAIAALWGINFLPNRHFMARIEFNVTLLYLQLICSSALQHIQPIYHYLLGAFSHSLETQTHSIWLRCFRCGFSRSIFWTALPETKKKMQWNWEIYVKYPNDDIYKIRIYIYHMEWNGVNVVDKIDYIMCLPSQYYKWCKKKYPLGSTGNAWHINLKYIKILYAGF